MKKERGERGGRKRGREREGGRGRESERERERKEGEREREKERETLKQEQLLTFFANLIYLIVLDG